MGRTLYEVVPGCLHPAFLQTLKGLTPAYDPSSSQENAGFYPVHVETGKRVYQLYAELDLGDDDNPQSLAVFLRDKTKTRLSRPMGLCTLGGAGGQTVFGALTTGTPWRRLPVAAAC